MIQTLAEVDWAPVIAKGPGWAAAMVTLTYPGDWRRVCPDGTTAKRHFKRFVAHTSVHGEQPQLHGSSNTSAEAPRTSTCTWRYLWG